MFDNAFALAIRAAADTVAGSAENDINAVSVVVPLSDPSLVDDCRTGSLAIAKVLGLHAEVVPGDKHVVVKFSRAAGALPAVAARPAIESMSR